MSANPKDWRNALVLFFVLEGLIALQALAAHFDSFLTVNEMQRRGIQQGLPLLWHGGIWGDVFLVSPLAALLCKKYCQAWSVDDVIVAGMWSVSLTVILAWVFTFGTTPSAHGQDSTASLAGILHLAYIAIAIFVFLLFYLFTAHKTAFTPRLVTILLIVHTFAGTHMALGVIGS